MPIHQHAVRLGAVLAQPVDRPATRSLGAFPGVLEVVDRALEVAGGQIGQAVGQLVVGFGDLLGTVVGNLCMNNIGEAGAVALAAAAPRFPRLASGDQDPLQPSH